MNLSNQWGLSTPTTRTSESALAELKQIPAVARHTSDFVGIEIEIEGTGTARDHVNGRLNAHINAKAGAFSYFCDLVYAKTDGSLRNNGVEFVTYPIHCSSVESVLSFLYNDFIRKSYPRSDFSERCGIHGHFDVTRLNISQIKMFTMLYMIYEDEFFKLAGQERACSNFCVPIRSQAPWTWFPKNPDDWSRFHDIRPRVDNAKYSAFNITRMADLGTVEFRHLPGTWDIKTITLFFELIQQMKEFSIRQQCHSDFYQELDIANTVSSYRKITDQIFGKNSRLIWPDDGLFKGIEEGVSFAKKFEFLVKNGGVATKPASSLEIMENPEFSKKFSKFLKTRTKGIPQRNWYEDDDEVLFAPEPGRPGVRAARLRWPLPAFNVNNDALVEELQRALDLPVQRADRSRVAVGEEQ